MIIRPYQALDYQGCVEAMNTNVPRDFLLSEVEDFKQFLLKIPTHQEDCPYWVLEDNSQIVGCGGVGPSIRNPDQLVLIWGMVARQHQKSGLGKLLLMHRLEFADKNWPGRSISLDTSQYAAGFFTKYGFERVDYIQDGYGPGLDKIIMTRPGKMSV